MHLVQLFLPLREPGGQPQPPAAFRELRQTLAERYGGLTVYTRAPAVGLWQDGDGGIEQDDIVIFEVLVERVETEFWQRLRQRLEYRFDQRSILIRAWPVQVL